MTTARKVMQKRTFTKLAKEGKLTHIKSYSYDDMNGSSTSKDEMVGTTCLPG